MNKQEQAAYDKGCEDMLQEIGEMLASVTRVTIVHGKRRLDYEKRDFNGVMLSFQDDGQTLKVIEQGAVIIP